MNRLLTLFLTILLFNLSGLHAFGEQTGNGDGASLKTASLPEESAVSRVRLTVGLGLAYHNSEVAKSQDTVLGKYGGAVDFGAFFQVSPTVPLKVGVSLGLQYWGVTTTRYSISTSLNRDDEAYVFPVLPSIMYTFEVTRVFHPYIAMSAGPALEIVKTTYNGAADTSKNSSRSRIVFEGLIRPGIDFQFSRHFGLNVEPRVGILDGTAILVTNTAAIFSF